MATRAYSNLFSCLHDEAEPIGHFGNGTHHSVFRAVTWLDEHINVKTEPMIHDFAVVWDEDHDERVIPVVEALFMGGLLSPVLFIGESKGSLVVLVDEALLDSDITLASYEKEVGEVCDAACEGDNWSCSVVTLARTPWGGLKGTEFRGLINERPDDVLSYLRGIDVLWGLGVKPHKAQKTAQAIHVV